MTSALLTLVALLGVASVAMALRCYWSARTDLQALLEGLDDAALVVDKAGCVLSFNTHFEKLFGSAARQLHTDRCSLAEAVRAWATQAGAAPEQIAELTRTLCAPHESRTTTDLAGKHIGIKQVALPRGRFLQIFSDETDRQRLAHALQRSEDDKRSLLDIAPVGITIASIATGEVLFANRRVAANLGFDDPSQVIGRTALQFYAKPEQRQEMVEALKKDGVVPPREIEMLTLTGEKIWVLFAARHLEFEGQKVVYSATSNITPHKRAEEALRRSEQKLKDLLEIAPNAIFIFGLNDDRVLFHNRLARVLAGIESGSMLGLSAPDFFVDPSDRAQLIDSIQREGVVKERELRIRTASKDMHWFHVSATMVEYEGQAAMFCAMLDIDARRQAETQLRVARADVEGANRELRMVNMELEQLASTDRLTRAFNRRHFEEVALREMSRARRYSLPLALIMVDIDYFKAINDDHGHAAGDLVLVELTQLLRTHLRSSDVLARWGGEEFVILATSTALDEAVLLAEKLRELFQQHEFTGLGSLSFSAGVTSLSFRDTLDTFIRRVDKALYMAKDEGRNRVASLGAETLV